MIRPALLLLATALPLIAAATDATHPPPAPPATEQAPNERPPPPHNCLKQTGSHLPRSRHDRCVNGPGRVIEREEIEQSGQTDVGKALSHADPSITTTP